METQFENIAFDVIDRLLDRLSERSLVQKEVLWATWRDMFDTFPTKSTAKKSVKKTATATVVPLPQAEPVPEPEPISAPAAEPEAEFVPEPVAPVEAQVEEPMEVDEPQPVVVQPTGCTYIMLRGERAGQPCNKPISKKKSDCFCVAHCK